MSDRKSDVGARTHPGAALAGTPELERLLARLRGRLEGLIVSQGLGLLLLCVSAWLAFAFVADWALHVPLGLRWFHLLVLLAIPVVVLALFLARPWRRRPGRAGLAILCERAQPRLRQLLVSAVELQERPQRPENAHPELVAAVLLAADREARSLSPAGILDPRRPRAWLAAGAAGAAVLLTGAALRPLYASIFLDRLLGGDTSWPQLTQLYVSIPVGSADGAGTRLAHLAIDASSELIEVVVARGNDVPVLVRAEGRVPDQVVMHLDTGADLALASSGDGQFRTVLRSCQEELGFHVTGGDDLDGLPRVHVLVLDPPDVASLAVEIEPPAYTGLERSVRFDRDVEVLAGSRLAIVMRPDPPQARGVVRILPEDRVIELAPRPFPAPDAAATGEPTGGEGLGFELAPSASLRYRFELKDERGLENPDPGLFAVHVTADRRPEVELLAPARGEIDLVSGGMLRIVARAADDFGIAALSWHAGRAGREEQWGESRALELRPVPPRMSGDSAAEQVCVAGSALLEVADLPQASGAADGGAPAEGEVFLLQALSADNRPPRADAAGAPLPDPEGVGRSATVHVRIVSVEEFLRRLQDRLARLRAQAGEAEELQREKAQRVRELIAALESDQPESGTRAAEISAALAGQRRVQGDVDALTRELAALVEGVLYARIDQHGTELLAALDERLGAVTAKGFDPLPWRELAAQARASAGTAGGLARALLEILELALSAGADHAARATAALDRASTAIDLEEVHRQLVLAGEEQAGTLERLAELVDRLAEWDNFQSVLNLARDILSRQKSVRDRTKETLEAR